MTNKNSRKTKLTALLLALCMTASVFMASCNGGKGKNGLTDSAAVSAALTAVEGATYGPAAQSAVNTEAKAKELVQGVLDGLDLKGATAEIDGAFTAAVAETVSANGSDGKYIFVVTLTKGAATASTDEINLIITKTAYDTAPDNAAIAAAKGLIEGAEYQAEQYDADNKQDATEFVKGVIAGLALNGVTATVNAGAFTAPVAETAVLGDGQDGSLEFTATLTKGKGTAVTTGRLTLNIGYTVYDPAQDNLDIAAVQALIEALNLSVPQANIANASAAKSYVQTEINKLDLNNVASVVNDSGSPAYTASKPGAVNGANGSYKFTVTLNKGAGTQVVTAQRTLTIEKGIRNTAVTLSLNGENYEAGGTVAAGGPSAILASLNDPMPTKDTNEVNLAGNAPTKYGYNFQGYYRGATGSGDNAQQYYNATMGAGSQPTWNQDEDTATIYARWAAKTDITWKYNTDSWTGATGAPASGVTGGTYTVTFAAVGGTSTSSTTGYGSAPSGSGTQTVRFSVRFPALTKTGYTFLGWWAQTTGGTWLYKLNDANTPVKCAEEHRVAARWLENNGTWFWDFTGAGDASLFGCRLNYGVYKDFAAGDIVDRNGRKALKFVSTSVAGQGDDILINLPVSRGDTVVFSLETEVSSGTGPDAIYLQQAFDNGTYGNGFPLNYRKKVGQRIEYYTVIPASWQATNGQFRINPYDIGSNGYTAYLSDLAIIRAADATETAWNFSKASDYRHFVKDLASVKTNFESPSTGFGYATDAYSSADIATRAVSGVTNNKWLPVSNRAFAVNIGKPVSTGDFIEFTVDFNGTSTTKLYYGPYTGGNESAAGFNWDAHSNNEFYSRESLGGNVYKYTLGPWNSGWGSGTASTVNIHFEDMGGRTLYVTDFKLIRFDAAKSIYTFDNPADMGLLPQAIWNDNVKDNSNLVSWDSVKQAAKITSTKGDNNIYVPVNRAVASGWTVTFEVTIDLLGKMPGDFWFNADTSKTGTQKDNGLNGGHPVFNGIPYSFSFPISKTFNSGSTMIQIADWNGGMPNNWVIYIHSIAFSSSADAAFSASKTSYNFDKLGDVGLFESSAWGEPSQDNTTVISWSMDRQAAAITNAGRDSEYGLKLNRAIAAGTTVNVVVSVISSFNIPGDLYFQTYGLGGSGNINFGSGTFDGNTQKTYTFTTNAAYSALGGAVFRVSFWDDAWGGRQSAQAAFTVYIHSITFGV